MSWRGTASERRPSIGFDPATAKLLEAQAMQTVGHSPEAFASLIKRDIAIWKQVADQAKVEVR